MSAHPAHAIDVAPPSVPVSGALGLSPVEAQERLQLREAMRLRRSVDHFARGWYGAIASLILSGIAVKLFVDQPVTSRLAGLRWSTLLFAALAVAGWSFAATYLLRSRRSARAERAMLVRLQILDERSPKPPELF